MYGAWGVIDTVCTKNFSNNFEKWKSYAKQGWYAEKIKNACGVNETACMIFAFENRSYLGEFQAEFKKALARESEAQGV
jgi:hypothetical protein